MLILNKIMSDSDDTVAGVVIKATIISIHKHDKLLYVMCSLFSLGDITCGAPAPGTNATSGQSPKAFYFF